MSEQIIHISASVLSADPAAIGDCAIAAEAAGTDSIHVDITDGHYTRSLSFGPDLIPALKHRVTIPIVAHLEVTDPDRWIPEFAGADMIVVQEDTCPNLPYTIDAIRLAGTAAGIGVNPDRTFRRIEAHPGILGHVDLVIAMGVYPGFAGQTFAATTFENIAIARRLRDSAGANYSIAVDGGVNADTIPAIVGAGADYLICGSSVFSESIDTSVASMRRIAESSSQDRR